MKKRLLLLDLDNPLLDEESAKQRCLPEFFERYRMFLDGQLTIEQQRQKGIEYSFGASGLRQHELVEMALVTNGSSEQQRKKLKWLDLERNFAHVFISEEVGSSKLDRKLFEFVLARTGREPQDCIFVGDNLQNDILPTLALGMEAVWINHFGTVSGVSDSRLRDVPTAGKAVGELRCAL